MAEYALCTDHELIRRFIWPNFDSSWSGPARMAF